MFRHYYKTDYDKMIASPDLFQHRYKQVASLGAGQKRESLITTGGNKVQIRSTVVAMQRLRHSLRLDPGGLLSM
jgi:hypothetical protein